MDALQHVDAPGRAGVPERDARRALREQIARLERELSRTVAAWFPHIDVGSQREPCAGPRLLNLGELERQRDELAQRLSAARAQAAERALLQQRARALLEDMKREPRRHKFVRLAVSDLGEGSCGFWHVRPRLGLIGMLAGWWQVTLSSGCP